MDEDLVDYSLKISELKNSEKPSIEQDNLTQSAIPMSSGTNNSHVGSFEDILGQIKEAEKEKEKSKEKSENSFKKKININIENDIINQENEKEINHRENNINKQIIINIKENKNDEKNKIEENKEINNIIIKKDGISIINSQQLNKNFQKKNIIKKISIIDLDSKKKKDQKRKRTISFHN